MKIRFQEGEIECGPASQQDCTGARFVDIADNQVVYGSCYSQETPNSVIFRPDMTGVTFRNCNLMNVLIPPGNTVIDCQTQRFKVQNDHNDWMIDALDKPVLPLNHKIFTKRGLPMPDPKDIPAVKSPERVDLVKAAEEKLARAV